MVLQRLSSYSEILKKKKNSHMVSSSTSTISLFTFKSLIFFFFCNEWKNFLSFPQMVTALSQHRWLNHPITPSHLITQFNEHKPLCSIYTSALSAWNPACLPHCSNYSSSVACLLSLGVTSLPSPIALFGICSLFLGCLFFHMNFQIHLSPSKVIFTIFIWLWSLCGFI